MFHFGIYRHSIDMSRATTPVSQLPSFRAFFFEFLSESRLCLQGFVVLFRVPFRLYLVP